MSAVITSTNCLPLVLIKDPVCTSIDFNPNLAAIMVKNQAPKKGSKSQYSSIFTVLVGPTDKVFFVHKVVVCEISSYFLENKEAQIMTFPKINPSTFDIFLTWVYTKDLPTGYEHDDETQNLKGVVRLYNFCLKLRVPELLDYLEREVSIMLLNSDSFSDPSILSNLRPKGNLRDIFLKGIARSLFNCIENTTSKPVTKSVTKFLAEGGKDVTTVCQAMAEMGKKPKKRNAKYAKGCLSGSSSDSDSSSDEEY